MTSVTEAEASSLPIDVATISKTLELTEGMVLSKSTREDIDTRTNQLIGHLALLQGQPLGEDGNRDTLRLLRLVERHLTPEDRPTPRTPAHEAFFFMHDTAVFVRAMLKAYRQTTEDSAS